MRLADTAWKTPACSSELGGLVRCARGSEREVLALLNRGSARQDDAVRALLVGNAQDACDPPLDMQRPLQELCERAIRARGPLDRGHDRLRLRERARLYLALARGGNPLSTPGDLLRLWDEATRGEPLVRNAIDEPCWRTSEDPIPFTGSRTAFLHGIRPLQPGYATADPHDIEPNVESIMTFVRESELPPEVVAFSVVYPLLFTHPFVDGNGHTTRLLVCSLLHGVGYSTVTLLSLNNRMREDYEEHAELLKGITSGAPLSENLVAFELRGLLSTQADVKELLESGPRESGPHAPATP